ncbi:bromodomain and PHD finger-containing protein 3 [Mycena metata]|uniref:Bromodomain and PHD finger-containing protein 3 n=1 Tax=Mycena metata TaxID=1033252 RepID=A0AAD7K339_9AGAR|nr:bromodomain and PHD finger-containing protein 3 [Mycena metata]
MARGGHASPVAPAPALPKVSFEKIEDDVSTQPSGVHEIQARGFGYNDFSDFHRPDQYIRHIEPLEIDLERQVEYDMDEQDQEWLDAVNAERKKEQLDRVTYEVFEVVMDRLEKEWFNLTKHIPKPDLALPSEDSTCAICDDSEADNSNAIVFCDGCNLAVHQDCYGVPYIPEGQWLCRKCTVSPENPVSCILCPNEGGAFKQTSQGEWIHLLCAIWVPETRVSNDVFMEPIIGVEKIVKPRWKLKCIICGQREGACIQCARQSCSLAFHVTCGRKDKLLLPMKSTGGVEPGQLTAYCDKHLSKEQADLREAALEAELGEEEDEEQYNSTKLSKSARAYAKSYRPGPPLVPSIIIDRILQYINRTTIRKKQEFIAMMCKYWSLKREARRGAPLLKRLHLEPWTASTSAQMQGEEEKLMKLEQLQHLRKDLEDLKGLTQLSRKRETRKLKQAELIQDFLSRALFPHALQLRSAFERISALDRNDYFKLPVSKKDVPDYFEVVKNPMSWSSIEAKLDTHQYWDIQSFKDDIHLVLDNAILYNKEGTTFRKAALRIQANAQPILVALDTLSSSPNLRSTEPTDNAPSWTPPVIGDLEPPLEILELLLSADALKDDSDLILSSDPITSLFNFELEKKKLPPTPPDPLPAPSDPPPRPKGQKTRDREVERERARERRRKEQELQAAAEASTSISAPPRRSRAPVSATSGEASGSSEASRAPRPRRSSAQLAAPGDIPLVEHVDERDSFTMFEQGWILPAGSRRNNRVAADQASAPPPKKRARLDRRGTSRLSVFSTAASDNQTLQDADEPPRTSSSAADNSMDVDESGRPISKATVANRSVDSGPSRVNSLPLVTPERVFIPPPNVIRTPEGLVIIEELDTPAIRKEKSLRRKEERLAAEAAAAADAQMDVDPLSPPLSSISPTPEPERDDREETDADAEGSELSDLSDFEADPKKPAENSSHAMPDEPVREQDQAADAEQHILDRQRDKPAGDAQEEPAGDEQEEPAGAEQEEPAGAEQEEPAGDDADKPARLVTHSYIYSLLTALSASFPWWPAMVFRDGDELIPAKVLNETLQERKKKKSKKDWLYIIRFFDKTKSWQYLPLDKMRALGEIKGAFLTFHMPVEE